VAGSWRFLAGKKNTVVRLDEFVICDGKLILLQRRQASQRPSSAIIYHHVPSTREDRVRGRHLRCLRNLSCAPTSDATVPPLRGVELTVSLAPASSAALAEIAESIGGLPRVLLRDTYIETEPGPIVKPSSPAMTEPPDRPNKYQLFGIGWGGMGAILSGRDVDFGRDLAVKVLLDSHKDKPDRRRTASVPLRGPNRRPRLHGPHQGRSASRRGSACLWAEVDRLP
jgi:hypothetical protein